MPRAVVACAALRLLPKLRLNSAVKDLFAFDYDDFELLDYNPQRHIKAKVAV